jgi:hypothetical protein
VVRLYFDQSSPLKGVYFGLSVSQILQLLFTSKMRNRYVVTVFTYLYARSIECRLDNVVLVRIIMVIVGTVFETK